MLIVNIASAIKHYIYYFYGWIRASVCGVKLAPTARISPFARIKNAAYIGNVTVGRDVVVGKGTYINSGIIASGTIGSYCSIAYNVLIGPAEHDLTYWTTSPYEAIDAGFSSKETIRDIPPPVIGDGVWIGAHVVVLRGVNIGSRAVVAAGSIVKGDIPANEIWGGVPAKKLKGREHSQCSFYNSNKRSGEKIRDINSQHEIPEIEARYNPWIAY